MTELSPLTLYQFFFMATMHYSETNIQLLHDYNVLDILDLSDDTINIT